MKVKIIVNFCTFNGRKKLPFLAFSLALVLFLVSAIIRRNEDELLRMRGCLYHLLYWC